MQHTEETTFLNNTRLFAELVGSAKVSRKEPQCQVVEIIGRIILKCKTHEIRDVLHKLKRRTHPNKMTSRGIRAEALLTSGGKHNGDIVVVWMLRCQETEVFDTSSIAFVAILNNTTKGVLESQRSP